MKKRETMKRMDHTTPGERMENSRDYLTRITAPAKPKPKSISGKVRKCDDHTKYPSVYNDGDQSKIIDEEKKKG